MLTAPILTASPYVVRVDYAPGRAVIVVTTPPDAVADHLTTDTFHTRRRAADACAAHTVPLGHTGPDPAPLYPRQLAEDDDGRRATFGTRRRWQNAADPAHPLTGQTRRYLTAEGDPYARPDDGAVILAPGHAVHVLAVFRHWNGPGGPVLAYVDVPATGHRTHVPVAELV